jgi:mono/diheme cytochrome c family protein
MEDYQLKKLKVILLVSSLVSLVLLLLAAFEENISGEWRDHQKAHRSALLARAPNDSVRHTVANMEINFKQVFLPDLNRVDRCITCHVGVEDPTMSEEGLPLRAHSGEIFEHHPMDKFGCTVCHDGQGRATEKNAAHGEGSHWPTPLLRGEAVYRSCGRCHYENDLYGADNDLFSRSSVALPIVEMEIESSVPGGEAIARGKRLVSESGCLGCHKFRGRGGTLGPDISYVGEKGVHEFDFAHVEGERTVANWLFSHFKNPQEVVPGTLMPDMDYSDRQAHELTEYVLGLRRKSMPASHTPIPPRHESKPLSGKRLYGMFCKSCHGERGQGSTVRDPEAVALVERPQELMVPSLNNPDTLAVMSDDYLRSIVEHGRSGTNMIAWTEPTGGGLLPEEVERIVAFVRSWENDPPALASISSSRGNARLGRALFRTRCTGCHGQNGKGGIGVSLNSPSFLAVASDGFLAQTIVEGRRNTAMPSWKQLSVDEINDILAYIRSWELEPAKSEPVLARLRQEATPTLDTMALGHSLYRMNCATCHGNDGEGALGPSLNTNEFLSLVEDEYLFTAIVMGRPDTAMPSWRHLSADDVADLIHYLRGWNGRQQRELESYTAHGDWERGESIFTGVCAGCHGSHAEGGIGPQLGNPVFLASVDDAQLKEWISNGKLGTPMPSFKRGNQGVVDLSDSQIEDVVTYLRRLEIEPNSVTSRPGMGIVSSGAEVYASACVSCHGSKGEGGTGSALSNPDFLRAAPDGFLLATVALGRDGTEMRAMGKGGQGYVELSAEEINNVVAFIRNWEVFPPISGIPHRQVAGVKVDIAEGEDLYNHYCIGCHGENGKDGWAPMLNNPEFLAAATDGFLQATIARGRSNTAMWSFGRGAGGVAELSGEQINNIVAFIGTWRERVGALAESSHLSRESEAAISHQVSER